GGSHHLDHHPIGDLAICVQVDLLVLLRLHVVAQLVLELLDQHRCLADVDLLGVIHAQDELLLAGFNRCGACVRQVHLHALLDEGCGDHEDDEEHQHHVHHGRDVDLAHRGAAFAAAARRHSHGDLAVPSEVPVSPGPT